MNKMTLIPGRSVLNRTAQNACLTVSAPDRPNADCHPSTRAGGGPAGRLRSFAGCFAALWICLAPAVAAQVTVSNLEGANGGTYAIHSGSWAAAAFTTDSFAYTLDSVTLKMLNGANNSGNFFVQIYADESNLPTGSALQTLSGTANPFSAGNYTFTSAGLALNANSTYWLVAGVSSGAGSYIWSPTHFEGETNTGGSTWSIGDANTFSTNLGDSWKSSGAILQFSATASAIPEPSTYAAFAGLGALAFVIWRRRSPARNGCGIMAKSNE